MNRTKKPKTWLTLCVRGILLIAVVALFLLCPDSYFPSGHWSGSNVFVLAWARIQLLGPLCWGIALFFLLGCLDIWLRRRQASLQVPMGVRIAAIALSVVLIGIGAYAAYGFVFHMAPLSPIPFELGLYFMKHSVARVLWWCVCAAMLHVALLRSSAGTAADG